jgi:hypothetical protein
MKSSLRGFTQQHVRISLSVVVQLTSDVEEDLPELEARYFYVTPVFRIKQWISTYLLHPRPVDAEPFLFTSK